MGWRAWRRQPDHSWKAASGRLLCVIPRQLGLLLEMFKGGKSGVEPFRIHY